MLRELMDTAALEDFASGLARAVGLRAGVYDGRGRLIVASSPVSAYSHLTGDVLGQLPLDLRLVRVPAHDPPGQVAYVADRGVWWILAPVYIDDHVAGYLGVGEFREHSLAGDEWARARQAAGIDLEALIRTWERLPLLNRSGQARPLVTVRWGARLLAEWSRRESRLMSAQAEATLVGDIAELLTGAHDLQFVLDRLVRETARVMECPCCSLRLYNAATGELTIKAVHNLSPDYLGKGAVLRTPGSVDDQALSGQLAYIEDVAGDERFQYPDQARREGIVSMLTAGMLYRGQPVGVIRVYTSRRRRFRRAQRELLRTVAYQAATAVVHAQLVEERLRNAEMQRQLQLAGDLQTRLVRTPAPRHPRLETALVFQPCFRVGGDFCDFLTLCDGRLAAVVGDVVGKGIPASLLMSSLRGALRASADWCCRPGELLTHLNGQYCRETRPSEFVTLLVAAIDAAGGRLTYANAGHEPILILRAGQVLVAEDGDLVLGVNPEEVYHEHVQALEPGDLLLLYTDGAIEARNFADEQFGRGRLSEALQYYGGLAPQQVLNNILWDIRRFTGLAEQADDVTMVAVRVLAHEQA